MSTEYRKPIAEWHFSVWADIDAQPHTDWTVTSWQEGHESYSGTVDGPLENAIPQAYFLAVPEVRVRLEVEQA